METNVAAALAACDYQQATLLLQQWHAKEPGHPLLRLYAAQLQEQTNRLEAAKKNYLALLKQATSSKAISKARAGLQRIEKAQTAAKGQALAAAKSAIGGSELSILAIAALPSSNQSPQPQSSQSSSSSPRQSSGTSAKQQAAVDSIAKVFNLDPYTARLKLPIKGFRIHRISSWGEVSYYAQQLAAPSFCTRISQIRSLQTFQTAYFEHLLPSPTVVCKNASGQLGKISFDLAEVSQMVSGQLPIYEQVVDLGSWGRTVHKERVQDYAQVLDLHLPGRQIVLRMCDRLYQYQKGISLGQQREPNSRIQWNELRSQLIKTIAQSAAAQSAQARHHSDFTKFGKSALEFIPLLPAISPNLDIDRRAPSDWDLAFHLYSSLCYFSSLNKPSTTIASQPKSDQP